MLDRFAPDLRQDPDQALLDMSLKKPVRGWVEPKADSLGLKVEDIPDKPDRYGGRKRTVSMLAGAARDVYLLQIPGWIADDANYVEDFDKARFGFKDGVVRVCASKINAESSTMERTFRDWKEHLGIDGQFIPWRRFEELRDGELDFAGALRLEQEWIQADGDSKPKGGAVPAAESKPDFTDDGTVGIFLASSSELAEDRRELEIWVRRQNKAYRESKVYGDRRIVLDLDIWEDFLDAVSPDGLQEEYNKRIRKSFMVICLFKTKVGRYTKEEFEVALKSMQDTGRPKYIYTYFKHATVDVSDPNAVENLQSLNAFKQRLKELKHYYTGYDSIADLQNKLNSQLVKILGG